MDKDGQHWYRAHNETKYFLEVPIDANSLARDYLQVYRCCMEYQLTFLFEEPMPCNLSLVCEFYANMKTEGQSQVVIVWGWRLKLPRWLIMRSLAPQISPRLFSKCFRFIFFTGPFITP